MEKEAERTLNKQGDSSEDDEEFIRKTIFKASAYIEPIDPKVLSRNTEKSDDNYNTHRIITISDNETSNILSKICDTLHKLKYDVPDTSDKVYTNFDMLLFYLEVSDIIKIQQGSRALFRIFDTEQLKRVVRIGNLDSNLRSRFWINQCPFFSYQNEVREILGEPDFFINVYDTILKKLKSNPIDNKVRDEIGRDLPRTFTGEQTLSEDGISQLKNNLESLAYVIPDVGYGQGMNFIAATLLSILKEEELAFWIFYAMMKEFDMEHMYLPGVPELHLKNYQMSYLIRQKCPKLFNHLKHIQMTTDYFTSKWIMTVFANSLPFEGIPFIFDNLLQDGWSSVYRIGVSLLRSLEPQLLQMDMFEITKFLRERVRNDQVDVHKLLTEAEKISISHEDVDFYKEKFMVEQAELKLKLKSQELVKEQKDALKWAQEILDKTEPHAQQDILKFKYKIEAIEKDIKSHEKIMMAGRMEYDDIKEQFFQHKDSKKALESVYESLKLDLELRKHKKKSKFRKLFSKKPKNSKIEKRPAPPSVHEPELGKSLSANDPKASVHSATAKHTSFKATDLSSQNEGSSNSEGNQEDLVLKPQTKKTMFGFKIGKNRRSSSSNKNKELVKKEISQIEQDLVEIERKIANSENLK